MIPILDKSKIQNFKTLASFCSWAGRFESYLIANPEDRSSHDEAHFIVDHLSANTAFIALMAADLGINPVTNINWAQGQIHYMLGDNPRQSSYVVGYGNNPPKRPHHKGR